MQAKLSLALVMVALVLAVSVLARGVQTGEEPKPGVSPGPPDKGRIALDQPVALDLRSDPVAWHDQTFHLLNFHKVELDLDDTTRLTALLQGSCVTFDNVEYTVHAAVYDKDGGLLGTASSPYTVQRLWAGFVLTTQIELALDFGRSKRFTDAASVEFAISSIDVLTPDQWQAG